MIVFSSEAATAFSCGRQPAVCIRPTNLETAKWWQHLAAGVSPQTQCTQPARSRGAATAIMRCRRFAAAILVAIPFRGLTPTVKCCHRFAIQTQNRFAIKDPCRFAIRLRNHAVIWRAR